MHEDKIRGELRLVRCQRAGHRRGQVPDYVEGEPGAYVRGRVHQLPDVRHGSGQFLQTGDTQKERVWCGWLRAGTSRYKMRELLKSFGSFLKTIFFFMDRY